MWEENTLGGYTSDDDDEKRNPFEGETIFSVLGKVGDAIPDVPKPILDLNQSVLDLWNRTPYGQVEEFVPQKVSELAEKVGLPEPVGQGLSLAATIAIPGPGEGMQANKVLQGLNRARKVSSKVVDDIDIFRRPPNAPLQPAFATAGVPNTIFSKGVNLSDDANLSKNFFEARLDSFRQRNLKARQERGWSSEKNINAKVTNPSWDLPKNQLDDLEELVSDWSREQADILRKTGMSETDISKIVSKRITKEWTGYGIAIDGQAHRLGLSNIDEVLQPKSTARLKLKNKKHLDARALASDPTQDPAVQQFFKRAHKQGALDSEFTLESYGKYSSEGAAWSDRVTVDMAKHFGGAKAKQNAISDWTMKSGALDKEHAWSIALKGSNDFLSQFFGSRMLNRSQGKLNSFTRDTMRILGAPSNNLESATNWAAEQMARKYKKTFYNPAQELMPSDWLRVQDAFARVPPGASKHIQEEVAMKVLREREIITAWHRADLDSGPKGIEALTAYMEKIWEIDVPKSKLILDRTIGEQAFKKVMKEMYGKNPKVPRWKGKTIVQPGAKIDEKTGRLRGIVREGGGRIQPQETLTKLPRDEAAQRYEYIKSTLDRLDEMDTTSNPFGLSEMQDRI